MPSARAWYVNNDMLATLNGLRSSTMASTAYLNNSLSVKLSVWIAATTVDVTKRVLNGVAMTFVTGTNGNYRYAAQSTAFSAFSVGGQGLAIMSVSTGGLNGEWRVPLKAETRGTS